MRILNQVVATPMGIIAVLSMAALAEAFGDSCFQVGLQRSTGLMRVGPFVAGATALAVYGLLVNSPPWDFGRLIGIYVVLFFLFAQILAKVRFNQPATPPILVGGFFILLGGTIITFWKR